MRLRRASVSVILLLGAAIGPSRSAPADEMATSQLVLLSTAPGAKPLGEREIQKMQEDHLSYLRRLVEERKVLLEGPIYGGGKLRSVVVFDVPSRAEAEALLREDPWTASGQVVAELHTWWSAKGLLRKPAKLDRTSVCYLGLLVRPPDAPSLPEEKLKDIQAGHMANIQKMAESKDLAIAGPMEEDTALRGILLFRTTDPDRIRELVSKDPAVQAGRLRLDLYPWYVPDGTLPE